MGHSTYVTDKRRQRGKGLANVLVGAASKGEGSSRGLRIARTEIT